MSNPRGFRMAEPSSLQLSMRNPLSVLLRAGASAILVALLICEAPGLAGQSRVPGEAQSGQQSGQQSGEVPQALHLLVGRSLVITSPSRIKRVSLADPAIAEAIVVSPFQVVLNGKAPGGVSLLHLGRKRAEPRPSKFLWTLIFWVLTEKIHEVVSQRAGRSLKRRKDVVMISGKISSPEVADKNSRSRERLPRLK